MGWRKLTVRDGGLARCCAAQRPIICGANLRFVLMRQHYPWQSDSGQQLRLGRLSPRLSGPRM